ncbi:MAG: hypothetical protein N3A38_17295, partial [Planctomycetota bacterium]|nr:hypothetical protein [Planctomycetota bacterium]
GQLYVLDDRANHGCFALGNSALHIFRRDGSYERTIKPFPAGIAPERVKATGAFLDGEGRLVPLIHRVLSMTVYPYEDYLWPQQFGLTPDGRALLAVVPPTLFAEAWTPHLALVDPDGGISQESYAGPALGKGLAWAIPSRKDPNVMGGPALAVGAGGKFAYLVGVAVREQNLPAVYRVPLPARGPAEVFFGDPGAAGSDERHLKDPQGIAADGKGLVFVSDRGNNRIVVVSEADGSFAGSFHVDAPSWVGIHNRSGAVYVRSGENVLKFSGFREPKELARLALPPRGTDDPRFRWSLALDGTADPT